MHENGESNGGGGAAVRWTSTAAACTRATCRDTVATTDDEPTTSAAVRQDGQPWKSAMEALRSKTMRRIPTITTSLRRFSIRGAAFPGAAATTSPADELELCAIRPPLRTFSLSELKKATRNFSKENVVGRGGHASVYRGILPCGKLVAVKRLSTAAAPESCRVESFLSELGHVVTVSHPNIAALVGVGVDGGEHLVFPFSRLGCLSGRLHGAAAVEEPMPWEARYRVAVGAARGLEYLHERCARRIVHRDVKPANILLKDDYEPMICDFGLAKWLPAEMTHYQVTTFEGTFGYVPPEYTSHGIFNEKTDVFAYGVVLLELITGRRAIDGMKHSLVTWARPFLDSEDEGDDDELVPKMVDPALGGRYDVEQLRSFACAARLCINSSPAQRPLMSQVVKILHGDEEEANQRNSIYHTAKMGDNVDLHETDDYDAVRWPDDMSRHRALAFDFMGENTYTSHERT